MNVQETISTLTSIGGASSETARLDAQVLTAYIMGKSRAWILAHPEEELQTRQVEALQKAAAQLESGVPLPYILGHWEFFGLNLALTPDVLIPRPETELLVEQALHWLATRPGRRLAVDVGTGSGCIAAAIAKNNPRVRFIASDISYPALRVAQANFTRLGLRARVDCVCTDLLPPIHRSFDLICANLPYIGEEAVKELAVYGREPTQALTPGLDGLTLIRRLLAAGPRRLTAHGLMLVEIEASQGVQALHLAHAAFPQAHIRLLQDLSGRDRLVRIENRGR